MSAYAVTTGSSNRTHYYSRGYWHGQPVMVMELQYDEDGPSNGLHELEIMTHFGEDAGGLWCPHCVGIVTHDERSRAEAASGGSPRA